MNYLRLLMLLLVTHAYSQDTIYLEKNYREINDPEKAAFYKVVLKNSEVANLSSEKIYTSDHELESEIIYKNYDSKDPERIEHQTYYRNGQLHLRSTFRKGRLHGDFVSFWETGQIKRKDVYKKGRWLTGTCWNEDGKEVPYYDFEIQPQFTGGMPVFQLYLQNKLRNLAIPSTLKGTKVLVRFTIDENGSVTQVQILKSLDPKVENKVRKVFEDMPQWSPARMDGGPMAVVRKINLVL